MRRLVVLFAVAACGGGGAGVAPDAGVDDAAPSAHWQPSPGTSWQIQFDGTIDTTLDVAMYDVDLFDTGDDVLAAIRGRGAKVVCYLNAGAREDWRSDAGDFPPAVIGAPLDGWPGENWLDIRADTVRTVMKARMDLAVTRGCDGVDPDNVDGYTNSPGFDFTADDQLDYNRFLAGEAHARGLAVGLKNDLDQVPDLVSAFDWSVDEQCHPYDECDALTPFITAHEPVFDIEYGDQSTADADCPDATSRDFDALIKDLALDAFRISCR